MVTGKAPFEGADVNVIMRKHLREPIVPPDHVNPRLSNGISEIVELCMAKDPLKRYITTADLIQDLQAVAAGQAPVQARKLIDLSELDALTEKGDTEDIVEETEAQPLTATPLFWIAVTGWVLVVLLIIILLAR
jgi:serine/threonine-protein kinase